MRRTITWISTIVTAFALAGAASATVSEPPPLPSRAGLVEQVNALLGYGSMSETTLRHPGAEYIKVHFSRLLLLPGDYVTVASPDGTESHTVTRPGWAMSVTGDAVKVTLHSLATGVVGSLLGATIDKTARGFTPAESHSSQREESVCANDDKTDAVCYKTSDPVPYRRSKAVARMLIKGTELCTGFRVGPSNRMLTNHHCVSTSSEAADTEVWFNYQCAECGGYAVFRTTKVWLSQIIATDRTLDYTVFSVTDFDQVSKYGYMELDVRRPAVGERLYVPQHPSGEPSKIAMTNCAVEDNAYEGYAPDTDISYYCDTAGGSSGSPVLSRDTDKVVALHHFGGCPNSGVRMDRIYQQIQGLI
ncbi:MAG TPA: serine protease [Candidatus Limnocylindrales bacterium]